MDMADEMNVGGKVLQHALATVGAVAADQDVALRKPGGGQGNEFHGQLRPGAMIGGWFGLSGLARGGRGGVGGSYFLLALGQPLKILVQAFGDGQGENLGGGPTRDAR